MVLLPLLSLSDRGSLDSLSLKSTDLSTGSPGGVVSKVSVNSVNPFKLPLSLSRPPVEVREGVVCMGFVVASGGLGVRAKMWCLLSPRRGQGA